MHKNTDTIRQEFLRFFQKKEHYVVPSSSLVPLDDQTLLFTNSGMNQFKNIFLGIEKPVLKRVVTVQRCVRAGGKHNDLDNVGYTDRHLTFFEMLGNFSFGDYFKHDAIQFAWELLTDSNWFNLSKDKIWVTTHIDDDESYNIWTKVIGMPSQHVLKIGSKGRNICDSNNFWQMGNIGPCGPCSEIFYDRGDSFKGIPPDNIKEHGDRYIEIWNLVFMQFHRQMNGCLTLLPMLSVDTGMGLERIAAILQGVHNNYAIDIFKNLIDSISQILKISESVLNSSLYVIADHIRSCFFLIIDGVIPTNEGRGYVLRRIIRRAIFHGKKLGMNNIFLYKLVEPLIKNMGYITDKLYDQKDLVEEILFNEEKLFVSTLKKGLELLEKELAQLQRNAVLNGLIAFRLYDTYGFPLELTKDICYKRNILVDQVTFNNAMLEQKKCSKKSHRFYMISDKMLLQNIVSKFVGYQYISYKSKIIALFQNNIAVQKICLGNEESIVVLDNTPFYGESGGQIGDSGQLKAISGVFKVKNTKKYDQAIGHIGVVSSGVINVGDQVYAEVDLIKRQNICLNHSATHLLHAALLKILGPHIIQRGSLVHDKYLRFDFSNYKAITSTQLQSVEDLVNTYIWDNLSININIMSIESARSNGAIMLVDAKYDQEVRVLNIGNVSIELCGGTHAKFTGEIGLFFITKEYGIGSGVRRIEALTKHSALFNIRNKKILLQDVMQAMQGDDENLLNKVYELKSNYNTLFKKLKNIQNQQDIRKSELLMKGLDYIKNVPILMNCTLDIKSNRLGNIISHLRGRLKSGIIILMTVEKNNTMYMEVNIDKKLIQFKHINALDLINCVVRKFGGKSKGWSEQAQVSISNMVPVSQFISEIHILLNNVL